MKITDKLPEKPIDQYQIIWYEINLGDEITAIRATYHLNTKWKDYDNERSGKDLIDTWMVAVSYDHKNFNDYGRIDGWDIEYYLDTNEKYPTKATALNQLIERTTEKLDRANKQAKEFSKTLNKLKAEAINIFNDELDNLKDDLLID